MHSVVLIDLYIILTGTGVGTSVKKCELVLSQRNVHIKDTEGTNYKVKFETLSSKSERGLHLVWMIYGSPDINELPNKTSRFLAIFHESHVSVLYRTVADKWGAPYPSLKVERSSRARRRLETSVSFLKVE